MDFGHFNILCVTVPLIIALCVMYYFHGELRDRICCLEGKIVSCRCVVPPNDRGGQDRVAPLLRPSLKKEPPLEPDADVMSEEAAAIGRSILDSMGPVFAVTLDDPPPGVRKRGRRPKSSATVVIESPSASEMMPESMAGPGLAETGVAGPNASDASRA